MLYSHLSCLLNIIPFLVLHRGSGFREEFSNISEARSILPSQINLMALTATASARTRRVILSSLCMHNRDPCVILRVPNKMNITYSVQTKPKSKLSLLMPLVKTVKENGVNTPKTLIFCPTYTECIEFFMEFTTELDRINALNVVNNEGKSEKVCAMFTGCTAESTKDFILKSFTQPCGCIRVVIATIAFGLGLDAPNIRNIIHWGPSTDIEAYVQESGRCGRDGEHSNAILYLSKAEQQKKDNVTVTPMIQYCTNTNKCRRVILMSEFAAEHHISQPHPLHNCCDICSQTCTCQSCQEMEFISEECFHEIQADIAHPLVIPPVEPSKNISHHALTEIKSKIVAYRNALCSSAKNEDNAVTLLFGIEIATLLTDKLIDKIVAECMTVNKIEHLLSLGVSSMEQAVVIFDIIKSELSDII